MKLFKRSKNNYEQPDIRKWQISNTPIEDEQPEIMHRPKSATRRVNKKLIGLLIAEIVVVVLIFSWLQYRAYVDRHKVTSNDANTKVEQTKPPEVATGKILTSDNPINVSAAQALANIKQTNKNFDLPVNAGYTRQLIRYTSSDGKSDRVPVYARVYMPANAAGKKLPVYAFAPGTTGMGETCASSLEEPAKRNWSNYDSLMAAYASQGYIVVITDYEGMRDPNRIHHYMVGDLEGRAMLDSVRALRNLPLTKNNVDNNAIFTSGYSQGGHAAYWADAIAKNYASDINLRGAIGFGPVTSVEETLTDAITANANINWFGPYVLTSYQEWYRRNYPIAQILQPQWAKNLRADALRECIDRASHYWPPNIGVNRSANLYTPEFIAAVKTGNMASNKIYAQFAEDLRANIVGPIKTKVPKLINQGAYDDVVLPKQNQAGLQRLCKSGNTVTYKEYTTSPYAIQNYNPTGRVDHYQTMNASFKDTLDWMRAIVSGNSIDNSCR